MIAENWQNTKNLSSNFTVVVNSVNITNDCKIFIALSSLLLKFFNVMCNLIRALPILLHCLCISKFDDA